MDCKEMILSDDFDEIISDIDLSEPLRENGITNFCVTQLSTGLIITYLDRYQIPPLVTRNYIYQYVPKCYGLMQIRQNGILAPFDPGSLVSSGILKAQAPPLELTGKGVIIAFMDTGIRYQQEVFRNTDGSSRILAIWDQTLQVGSPPNGFFYGTEYTKAQIDEALLTSSPLQLVPSTDQIGHGTDLAAVAAGSRLEEGRTFLGAAPECDIVVVKLKQAKPYLKDYYLIPQDAIAFSETDILQALTYLDGFTEVFKKPIVICFGLGTNMGDHTGKAYLPLSLNSFPTKRSRSIVVCGGNEGNNAHHFTGSVCKKNATPYEDVEIRVGDNNRGFLLELWGNIPEIFSIQIRSPGGEMIPSTKVSVGANYDYSFIYEKTFITVDFLLVEESSGSELMVIKFFDPTPGIWTVRVIAKGDCTGTNFDLWLPIQEFLYSDTYFLRPTPYITLTSPAYADRVLTTSVYQDSNNSFWVESGRGFGRKGSIVPDIAAPGVNVSTPSGKKSGSSLAAAITAGAVAQFMQWAIIEQNDIFVSGTDIKNYFILGADRDKNLDYPNREWGYGKLNVSNIFQKLAELDL